MASCPKDPAACIICQMCKLTTALKNGSPSIIAPWMFKAAIASGHPEFSSSQQQDAAEFLAHLMRSLQRSDSPSIIAPFAFETLQCLACSICGKKRQQKISNTQLPLQLSTLRSSCSLKDCLDRFFETESVEVACANCSGTTPHNKQISLRSLPRVLIVVLSRHIVRNWVPQKLEIPVSVPFEGLSLSNYISESTDIKEQDEDDIDSEALAHLMAMGFPRASCIIAIRTTGTTDLETAMNWLLENPQPAQQAVPEESLQMLISAGFSKETATQALLATELDVERAFDYILSHPQEEEKNELPASDTDASAEYALTAFISHKGPSMHCGHYISHIHLNDGSWVMMNDERVVKAPCSMVEKAAENAYIYIFERS